MSADAAFGFIITVLLIIAGFCFKSNKLVGKIQITYIWILMAFSTGGGDWKTHIDIFRSASTDNIFSINDGGLYNLICYLSKSAGLDFTAMNFIISTLLCIVIYKIAVSLAKYPSICFSLYLIYPFSDNIIQKRFFLASIVVIYGMKFIYNDEEKKYLKFLCACLIGGLIHTAAFAFILYGIVYWIIRKFNSSKWIFMLVGVSFLFVPVIPKLALAIFPENKINLYFYILKLTMRDMIFWTVFHLSFVIINSAMFQQVKKLYVQDKKIINRIDNLHILNLSGMIYMPLYYFEPTFIRFFRSLLILNWAVFSFLVPADNRIKVKSFLLISSVIVLQIAAFFLVYAITGTGLQSLIYPLFQENAVFRFLFSQ